MKKMKKLLCLLMACVLLISMSGCGTSSDKKETAAPQNETGSEANSDKNETKEGTHIIVDHNGNEVEVPYEINRIAVCSILPLPSVLAVFFDSADKIVGMSETSMTAAKNSLLGELYPEILDAETGYIEGSTINTEELMKLDPDVVFYFAADDQLREQLQNAGFTAVGVSTNKWGYDCIEPLNQWISLLSEMFPENDKTEIVRKYSEDAYNMVQERVSGLSEEEREKAFFMYQYSDTNLQTSGKLFFGQWWADAIGAINVSEELSTDNAVTANMEQIYAWNPSLIFMTNFTTAGPEDLYNNTVGNYDWSGIDAVENQRVYKMPLGMYRGFTPGVDTPVTLQWLAKTAYPELFEDIDIITVTKDYYKEVFGIELTDEQAASIFAPVSDAGSGF